ncbi:3-deoxy-manno-octulosonate cytidylyltransferase [Candidatus Poribacteria bacterium]|nr:MAG: 3-deoxy-manno-octulosonate cytidylyltransferase [Candidatus Poribacteria bacterium]
MKSIGIIPARYASSRFEGKPLADILGKPMIQHVYEGACKSKFLDQVIVATDDERIFEVVQNFNGKIVMTSECATGTERVAVVAKELECDIVLNIQGDEPLLEPEHIDIMLQPFLTTPSIQVCTLKERVYSIEDYLDPNVVKVVTNLNGDALYFSRSSLPHIPDKNQNEINKNMHIYRHIGLYAYRREQLLEFITWESTPNEKAEGLEQLRFLEHDVNIHVVETDKHLIGVDVPTDLDRVRHILEKRGIERK